MFCSFGLFRPDRKRSWYLWFECMWPFSLHAQICWRVYGPAGSHEPECLFQCRSMRCELMSLKCWRKQGSVWLCSTKPRGIQPLLPEQTPYWWEKEFCSQTKPALYALMSSSRMTTEQKRSNTRSSSLCRRTDEPLTLRGTAASICRTNAWCCGVAHFLLQLKLLKLFRLQTPGWNL